MSVSVIPAQESSHLASHAAIEILSHSVPLGRASEPAAAQRVRCGLPPRAKGRVLECVGSRYEGLLHQCDASIIEDPHAVVLVGPNHIDRIHAVRPCGRSFNEF
jgi:hypothetical protein